MLSRALLIFTIGLIVFLALNPVRHEIMFDRASDKFNHVLAFVTISVLSRLGYEKVSNLVIFERLSFLGAVIEVFQAMPSLHRDCDWKDWVADTIAVALTLVLIEVFRLRDRMEALARKRFIKSPSRSYPSGENRVKN
jgi:hypothetical protein